MGRLRKAVQRKPVAEPQPEFEATPERMRHAANDTAVVSATIDKAGERAKLTRRFRDSPIERMFHAKRITAAQHAAAVWYAERYHEAGLESRVVASYGERTSAGGLSYGLPHTEAQARSRSLLREARAQFAPGMTELMDRLLLQGWAPRYGGNQYIRYVTRAANSLQRLAYWLGIS